MAATQSSPASPGSPPKITFQAPIQERRGSIASTSSSVISDDPREDWTKITPDDKTWAFKERRRSSAFGRINNPIVGFKTSATSGTGEERRGSILSLWTSRMDPEGNHVLSSDGGRVAPPPVKPVVLTREQILDAREQALKQREKELHQQALDVREMALEVREQELAALEASRKRSQ